MTRTTRSDAPTEAGERLVWNVGSGFEQIDAELTALTEFRDRLAGTIRITAGEHAAQAIFWPTLKALHPSIRT